MEQNNRKIIAIIGIAVLLLIVAGFLFWVIGDTNDAGDISGNNNEALLGRYIASNVQNAYMEFSDKNHIEMCTGMITFQGTYTLNDNQLNIEWDMSAFGGTEILAKYGTVSDDKQEIVYTGATFTKR